MKTCSRCRINLLSKTEIEAGLCGHCQNPCPQCPPVPITPLEIEIALQKGAASAKELDKKLDQVFRPPTPREDIYLR